MLQNAKTAVREDSWGGHLIGHKSQTVQISQFGFSPPSNSNGSKQAKTEDIHYKGAGHLLTIAPTGSGKGTCCVIPTLLDYPGSVIAFDPKGENYLITARRRRKFGRVILLDPFKVTGDEADTLNPIDLLHPSDVSRNDDALMLAEMIVPTMAGLADPFWTNMARRLIAGLICFPKNERARNANLDLTRNRLNKSWDNFTHMLWEMKFSYRISRDAATAVREAEWKVRASIVSTAQQYFTFMSSHAVANAMMRTSFPIDILTRGEPASIYIVIPPEKLASHSKVLRLWIATLFSTIFRRQQRPELPTLFLLDEAAQLGYLPMLRDAITLMRGYGLQTWTFWQDISQLRLLYPNDWETLLNNADVLQIFGLKNMRMARDAAALSGHSSADDLIRMKRNEALLSRGGNLPTIVELPDYRTTARYRGQFDNNRFYGNDPLQ